MGKKVKGASSEAALTRVLDALKQELLDASDAEIRAAARELGMNLKMKECAAFAGLTYPSRPQLADFFEFEACRQLQLAAERLATPALTESAQAQPRSKPRRKRQRALGHRVLRGRKERKDE